VATVVDPQEDAADAYIEFAHSKGMKIAYVVDTHVQADHISGGRTISAKTGAAYCLYESADVAFDFTRLSDGQEIVCGNTVMKVLHTPGHTPESICLLITDRSRGPEPWFLLTGDTLFVGAVGRPDLPGRAEASARELYRSLHHKVLALPDTVEIYPSHFSGSVCGAGMSGKPGSTLGFEKRLNRLLSLGSEDEFVQAITKETLPKPDTMMAVLARNQGRDQSA
jgi:glyoxylase-like metal-dependent hydrolase (beta-lactamase superfamily II)